MIGGIAPGWYPDYEAPLGHERYWDGERWTARRSGAPEATASRAGHTAPWVLAAVAVVVVICAGLLVVGRDGGGPSTASTPPPASTPGPPASEQTRSEAPPEEPSEAPRRTWRVDAAVDSGTLRLDNGAEVRLVGIADACATLELARLAVGRVVTLTRRGPDKDTAGRLLRYVDRDGMDVGKRLIQKGWATASDDANPRRAIYRRIDQRSPDRCS